MKISEIIWLETWFDIWLLLIIITEIIYKLP